MIRTRQIKAVMRPVSNPKDEDDPDALGTDPTMAANFLTRMASTAKLTGRPVSYLEALSDEKIFPEAAPAIAVLGYTVVGTIVNGLIEDPKGTIRALKVGQPEALQEEIDKAAQAMAAEPGPKSGFRKFLEGIGGLALAQLPEYPPMRCTLANPAKPPIYCYKARPLNGIWATAPYLHNGSVRTLRQLLLPEDQRETVFKVGSRSFDADAIGFVNEGASTLDTSLPGNANTGHDGPIYGNDDFAEDPDRLNAILEYLKTL